MNTAPSVEGSPPARLGLIHTVPKLRQLFGDLVAELMPDTEWSAIVDESLLADTIRQGQVGRDTEARLAAHVDALAASGVDAVLVTCSSLGSAVERLAVRAPVPVIRVDQAMIDRALERGSRVGVLGTLHTTMEPTASRIERCGRTVGKRVEVVARLCDGAFDALQAGDVERHDELVRQGLLELAATVDVIVIAQASAARAAQASEASVDVPVLTSPRLAIERLASRGGDAAAR